MLNLTAVSTAALANTTQRVMAIQQMRLRASHLVVPEENKQFFQDKIDAKLEVFASQIGYPHGITSTQIIKVIRDSAQAFAALRSYKRRSDGRNFRDKYGFAVGDNLSQYYVNTEVLTELKMEKLNAFSSGSYNVPSISNSDYSTMVGILSENVFLPKSFADYLAYMSDHVFLNHINNDDGVAEVLIVKPDHTKKDELETALDTLVSAVGANTLIRTFMETHMGMNPTVLANSYDWNRDLSGTTINFMNDVSLIETIETTPTISYWRGASAGTPVAEFEFFYAPEGVLFDATNSESVINFSATQNIHKVLLAQRNDSEVPADLPVVLDVKLRTVGGSGPVRVPEIAIPNLIVDKLQGFSSITQADLQMVMDNLTSGLQNSFFDEPFQRYVALERDTNGNVTFAKDLTGITTMRAKSGYNLFAVNEDLFLEVAQDIRLSMLFGGTYHLSTPVNIRNGVGVPVQSKNSKNVDPKGKKNPQRGRNNNRNRNNGSNKPK